MVLTEKRRAKNSCYPEATLGQHAGLWGQSHCLYRSRLLVLPLTLQAHRSVLRWGIVPAYRNLLSHALQRRRVLRRLQAGLIEREDVCDADGILVAAADFHGSESGRACPICGKPLKEVMWVYGASAPSATVAGQLVENPSGTARSEKELAELIDQHFERFPKSPPLSVHWVEVCSRCRWNFLNATAQAVRG